MADHVQDQILDYFQALLVAGSTAAGARVDIERVDPVPTDNLPHLHLEAVAEDKPIEGGSIGFPRTANRFFTWSLTSTVAQEAGYGKACRNLAKQAEMVICASRTTQQAGGLARNGTHLIRTEFLKGGELERPVFQVKHYWTSGYQARDDAPDVAV